MLHKCANPACCAQFQYLHQGSLFEVEMQYFESPPCDGEGRVCRGKGHVERWWLCDHCSAHFALRFDPRRGLNCVFAWRLRGGSDNGGSAIKFKGCRPNGAGSDPALRPGFDSLDQARRASEFRVRMSKTA